MSKKLPHTADNVCLAVNEEYSTYAVGSKTNTDLIDARTLQVSIIFHENLFSVTNLTFQPIFSQLRKFRQETTAPILDLSLSKGIF